MLRTKDAVSPGYFIFNVYFEHISFRYNGFHFH